MAKDYSIWTVVLVAVVVALGTSLVTTSLTGSVITPGGTYDTQDRSLKVNGDLVLGSQATLLLYKILWLLQKKKNQKICGR